MNTSDEASARRLIIAKNEAERQPVLNLQIAGTYLSGSDSGISQRTWRDAIERLPVAVGFDIWPRAFF